MKFKAPQALAYGLPLVGTKEALGGLSEVQALGGIVVTSDPAAFAGAIGRVLSDVDAAIAVMTPAKDWVHERFLGEAVERLVDRYLAAQPE